MSDRSDRNGRGTGKQAPSARQASEWLVLLESGDANDEDRARFEAWLAADAQHRAAYAAVNETWARLTAMRGRVRAIGSLESGSDAAMQQLGRVVRPKRQPRRSAWAAAAAILAAAVLGGIVLLPGDSPVLLETEIGERRTVSLADGSSVELNTDTELRVEFTDERRRIALVRGEAFFEVAGDAARPFVVTAGQRAIRAVGTGFAVRLRSADRVSVTVTEGIVEVRHSNSASGAEGRAGNVVETPVLRRGQRAEYDRESTRVEVVAPAELERSQAWRRGLLVFEDASLAEVVDEVNRYTETKIVFGDPAIGALRLGGTFKAGRLDALLYVLDKSFGIQASHVGNRTIELERLPEDSTS